MPLNKKEEDVLKELADRYMAAAQLPVQKEKKELWKALNRGEMQRPMVVIDQLPWSELNECGILDLYSTDPYWRNVEWDLRTTLYKWEHFPVDMVLDPFIRIPKCIESERYGIVPDVDLLNSGNYDVSSQHFNNQIKDFEDINKIKNIAITHHEDLTKAYYDEARVLFSDIVPLQSSGMQFHLGVWDFLSQLMGVEAIYYDFNDRPEFIHACMRRITDAAIAGIKEANRLGLNDDNINTCHCSYIYTDELLSDSGKGKGPKSENCWAFGLAQLFTSVSPDIFEEFELPYISEMAEYFGMIYYGCCDRLDDRLHLVKKIPKLKKVSCSPWSNRKRFAENIGKSLIMSNKPSPAFLAADQFDTEIVRRDLLETIGEAKRNCINLEFILKDVSTVRRQPERLSEWAKIAMDAVENW